MFSAGPDGDHNGNGHYMDGVVYKLDGTTVTMAGYVSGFAAATTRVVEWAVPTTAPNTLYYWCHSHTGQGDSFALSTFTDGTFTGIALTGGSGTGAAAQIGSLSNTSVLPINKDTIQPMANVVLNTGPTFVSLGANTSAVSANLANANVSSQIIAGLNFVNTTVGTIASVITTDFGFGYDGAANTNNLPTATVIDFQVSNLNIKDPGEFPPDFKGRDALLGTRNVAGAITDVTVGAGSSVLSTDHNGNAFTRKKLNLIF